jgi:hypothetical protein
MNKEPKIKKKDIKDDSKKNDKKEKKQEKEEKTKKEVKKVKKEIKKIEERKEIKKNDEKKIIKKEVKKEIKNIEEKKEIKDSIKEINCGHKFHNCCWDDWVIKNEEICPICNENLKYEDSFDDFEKKIINIQRNIHKDFNEIKFKYNKKKLTYKFIDFNNKETIANLY